MKQSKTKTLVTAGILALLGVVTAEAQTVETFSPVLTAVPSLQITPDARAAGMGDLGTSTSPDPYAQYWNPAKFAFIKSSSGVSLGYTPWLSRLVSDIALMHVGGYYKIGGEEGTQALAASLRYFTLGKLTRWDASGKSLGDAQPNEFAFDVSYSRKLSESYSMAVALRYIHSDQGAGQGQSAGKAFAADIAGYLHKYVTLGSAEALWTLGFNVRNIGTKISFDGGTNSAFIPTNLGLGTGLLYPIDETNAVSLNIEANKLLVPTPPLAGNVQKVKDYNSTSSIGGIFKSFGDATGGFKEELREVRLSLGAEYNHNDKFFVRAGYSYLHPTKGNLQALTAGAGFRTKSFRIDASYLISTIANNPLDQTLRFTLAFDIDGLRTLLK